MNGGCASRGKILSEERKTENKMDGRMHEFRMKKKKTETRKLETKSRDFT